MLRSFKKDEITQALSIYVTGTRYGYVVYRFSWNRPSKESREDGARKTRSSRNLDARRCDGIRAQKRNVPLLHRPPDGRKLRSTRPL